MPKTHFDQLQEGEILSGDPFSFTEEQIIRFCKEYDPQHFHTDPELAKDSHFGQLIASGWQTAAMALNTLISKHIRFPHGVLGMGVDQLRWKEPVMACDVLQASVIIKEKRLSASRPGWGIAVMDITVTNQSQRPVLEMHTAITVKL